MIPLDRRIWYIGGTLIAACVLLPLLLQINDVVDMDLWLFNEIHGRPGTDLMTAFQLITELGSMRTWLIIIPLLWLGRKHEAALTLLVALIVVFVVVNSMKFAIDRPRPYEMMSLVDLGRSSFDSSFPSGHTTNAFAGAVAVGLKWRKALPWLLALATAIGFSRVYMGVHFPLDVVAGASIGILIGLLAASIDLKGIMLWIETRSERIAGRFRIVSK